MQALILSARRGPRWLVEGFSLFRQKPALFGFLVLSYWLSMAVVSAVPKIGQAIGFILIPAFSVSLMNACQRIDRKDKLPPQVLFSGFHRNLQTLLTLGIIYVLLTFLILSLSTLFDEGQLFRMFVMGEEPPREVLIQDGASEMTVRLPGGANASLSDLAQVINDSGAGVSASVATRRDGSQQLMFTDQSGAVRNALVLKLSFTHELVFASQLTAVMLIPVFLAFWFAPVLAAWHDMAAGKALFFSMVACLRNWRPFMLYTLTVFMLCMLLPALAALLLPAGKAFQTMSLITLCLIFLPTLYASFYVSYRDIFAGLRDVA